MKLPACGHCRGSSIRRFRNSYCWTDFLSKISEGWKSKVGKGTAVNWPVGLGGKGNEGVAGLVKQTPNSIGYVELIYASHNSIDYGRLQNKAGKLSELHARFRHRSGRIRRQQNARGLPRVDHQCLRRGCLSGFNFYLVADLQDPNRQSQRPGHGRLPEMDVD